MTLHIFNPEHDMAMSHQYVTFPKVASLMYHGLGFLPALWADEGDIVVVDDVAYADKAMNRLISSFDSFGLCDSTFPSLDTIARQKTRFVVDSDVKGLKGMSCVSPWGWDVMICRRLETMGIDKSLLPSAQRLEDIRLLAHRDQARRLLEKLTILPATVGEAYLCTDIAEVDKLIRRYGRIVIKAPWSGSGRGVRFVDTIDNRTLGWTTNIMRHQGAVMVEPYYPHVLDFGMEFLSMPDGSIVYRGLSVFTASNGAYNGNILSTEDFKKSIITNYISAELLQSVQLIILSEMSVMLHNKYYGPFGIDMMIVESDNPACPYLLHPCVEINLRCTMGHVALSLQPSVPHLMTIDTKHEFMVEITRYDRIQKPQMMNRQKLKDVENKNYQ